MGTGDGIRVAVIALAASAACASAPKVEKIEEVAVRVDRLFPQADGLDASKIGVKLQLANPRSSAITIAGIDYTIDTGDVSGTLSGAVEGGTVLEAQQISEVEFSHKVPFPTEKEAYKAVLDQGQILLTLKGTVRFEDGTSADFERKGAVATPSLPKFVVHDAQAARYGKDGLDVTLYLRLINENVFTVIVDSVSYTVSINGKATDPKEAAIGARLTQGAAQEFTESIVMTEKNFENLAAILAGGEVEYTVTGKLDVADLELPIDLSGEVEFATESSQ